MYDRGTIVQFVNMLERGLFHKGNHFADTKSFSLEDWEQGFDTCAAYNSIGQCVAFTS